MLRWQTSVRTTLVQVQVDEHRYLTSVKMYFLVSRHWRIFKPEANSSVRPSGVLSSITSTRACLMRSVMLLRIIKLQSFYGLKSIFLYTANESSRDRVRVEVILQSSKLWPFIIFQHLPVCGHFPDTFRAHRVLSGLQTQPQWWALCNWALHTRCQPQFMSLTTTPLVKACWKPGGGKQPQRWADINCLWHSAAIGCTSLLHTITFIISLYGSSCSTRPRSEPWVLHAPC